MIFVLATGLANNLVKSILNIPKFKQGDCVSRVYEAQEFTPRELSPMVNKIVVVGKKSYLTDIYVYYSHSGEMELWDDNRERSIGTIDRRYVKVNCETGEEL